MISLNIIHMPMQMEASMKAWEYRGMPLSDRLAMFIKIDDKTGCHIFTGAKDGCGYGVIKENSVKHKVHRLIYQRTYGDIGDLCVLHKCDTPACCNPEHLFLGTPKDNALDRQAKGRGNPPRGYAHTRPMAKLTEEKAMKIKEMLKRGYRQCDIASDFKVSRQIVNDIAKNKTWCHLP